MKFRGAKMTFEQSNCSDIYIDIYLTQPSIFKKIFFWFYAKKLYKAYGEQTVVRVFFVNSKGKEKLLRKELRRIK